MELFTTREPSYVAPSGEAVVQQRPTLGTMPRARRGGWWWLQPAVDFVSASVALAVISVVGGVSVFPALPVAPAILVVACAAIGMYGSHPARGLFTREDGAAWPVIRVLLAVLFAWTASLMLSLDSGLDIALCAIFVGLDAGARRLAEPFARRLDRAERWMVVGDESLVARLNANEGLRSQAVVVGSIPAGYSGDDATERSSALEAVDRLRPSRIVISSDHSDDKALLDLVYSFKSLGVPVSLLPRLVDGPDSPDTVASQVGDVPLIDVQPLVKQQAPYAGPNRRRDRQTKVSVVVPAMNEADNIGHVLSRLPDGLHEVILVDGNSKDGTIEAARAAYPGIKVHTQRGRGKGDAFRVGFAAVTGNLVVMLDADGSADPAEISRFVATLEAGADFAKGSRFIEGGGSDDITRLRQAGNTFLSGSCNTLQGTKFTDLCYGYNAFWARCLPFISLDVPGFEVETLINLRVAAAGMRIVEVPSHERERISGQSNLKTFRDGFRVLGTILVETRKGRAIRRGHANY